MTYDKSIALYQRATQTCPGGVHSNIRLGVEPSPMFYDRAEGARIWDVDGNEYVDYVLGQGPMLLGHTPRPVIDAVQRQLQKGFVYAGQTELEVTAAELICTHVPCAEMVRFSTTGSEAVHAALRLARAATGRKLVLRFEGHYHGWFDNIAWNHAQPGVELGPREAPLPRPSSHGQQPEDGANLIVRPWNDLAVLEQTFAEHGSRIAAVICDTFSCAAGVIPGTPEFIHALRRHCDAHGALLVFDEVLTGFRIAVGGAQEHYGVTPDLATFAKALGAGMPVSAVAGRADLMRLFGDRTVNHAGTYSSNPLSMAGVVAALECLTRDGGAELAKAHAAGQRLIEGLKALSEAASRPLTFRGVGNLFSASFVPEDAEPITDFRSVLQTDYAQGRRFLYTLQDRGVLTTTFGVWFVSTVHTDRDIAQTLDTAEAALAAVTRG